MFRKTLLAVAVSLPLILVGSSIVSAESHPDGDDHERVVGLVTGEHGQTLALRTRHGEVDVHWSASTECMIGGAVAECEAIEVGMLVAAAGSYSGDSNQFQAEVIRARARPHDLVTVTGVVQSEAGQTLVVEQRDGGLVDVTWGDDTVCRTRESRFDCERLERGNRITAAGRLDGGTLQARAIGLHTAARPELARVHGVVTANHGQVLAVETRDGDVNVHFDAETACQTRAGRIDCSSIVEGSRVLAVGEELGERNLQAKRIFVGRATDVRPDVRPDGRHIEPTDVRATDVRPTDVRVTDAVRPAVID